MKLKRRTVRKSITFRGYPLFPGKETTMSIEPAPAGHGIRIEYRGKKSKPLSPKTLLFAGRGWKTGWKYTTVGVRAGKARIPYVEHQGAALVGAGITDATIKTSSKKLPALGDTPEIVFRAVRHNTVNLKGAATPLTLNENALHSKGMRAEAARKELEKRHIPKELFWPGKNQRVIMLEPVDKKIPDRIFLMKTRGASTIAAYTEWPGFKAIKPQWFKIPLTPEGFKEVMSARGVAFFPPVLGWLLRKTAGKVVSGVRLHGLTPRNRLIATKRSKTYLNPPGTGPKNEAEVAQHRIVDFLINVPNGLEGVSVLLYRTHHKTDLEMIKQGVEKGMLK